MNTLPFESTPLMVVGLIALFLCNALWYRAKFALNKKGYPVSWMSNHFRDFGMIGKTIIHSFGYLYKHVEELLVDVNPIPEGNFLLEKYPGCHWEWNSAFRIPSMCSENDDK